jgi:hypothetical protein
MAQWLGTWQCEYENKTGAQAKGEASMGCEWAAGGFFMVCKSGTWTSVAGYDSEEKAYGEFRYFNDGWMDFSKGWTSGNTWTFVYEGEHSGGKARRRQVVSTFQSPTVWTYQWDRSVEGGPWVTTTVGKCSKVK